MAYLHWIWGFLYGLIIVGVMIKVLLDNRQPAKTMAWILVLWFLPLLGILLYIFFGQNTRKEKLISQYSLDQLTKRSMTEFVEQRDLRLPKSHQPLMQLFKNQNMALPFKNNEVEIFTSGYEFFPALLREISKAKHHVHVEYFIFSDDELGNLIADALIDKAREGVEVRVIYDDVGCWNVKGSFFERMRNGGVDVHAFMPVKFPAFTSKVNYRNHRKLTIIDGQVGFIGGMNISTRYVQGTTRQAWRDTHLMVRGGAVYGIQRAFLVDWYFVDRTLITDRDYYPEQDLTISNDCLAQVVTSSPISPWPDIMQGYVRVLIEAQRYVYMESPYFLPTEPVLFAMRTAALTGVDVRLMVPMRGDSRIVDWASISYVKETIEAGVKVYLYKDGFNHSKMLVSDDCISTCGSTNIDARSFEHDFESNIFFYDEGMALRMKKVFLDDQEHCQLIEEGDEENNHSFLKRLRGSVLRLISPLL
ncbi:MAG: cardiolipin synthase [Prevotella sp.]|jgi:cardiolipin synthase